MIKIGSGNWIVDNLNSALETWNGKLTEIWQLISTTPEEFKGGGVWNVIVNINGALQAIGYALLVLFFVMGVVKTCGSFTELKKPEMAFKCFVRFILAQAAVMYGMELMTALFRTVQGMISTIVDSSGLTALCAAALPDEMVTIMESVGLIDSIPLWAIAPQYRAALSRWPGVHAETGPDRGQGAERAARFAPKAPPPAWPAIGAASASSQEKKRGWRREKGRNRLPESKKVG